MKYKILSYIILYYFALFCIIDKNILYLVYLLLFNNNSFTFLKIGYEMEYDRNFSYIITYLIRILIVIKIIIYKAVVVLMAMLELKKSSGSDFPRYVLPSLLLLARALTLRALWPSFGAIGHRVIAQINNAFRTKLRS
jgi:hypothetical protein